MDDLLMRIIIFAVAGLFYVRLSVHGIDASKQIHSVLSRPLTATYSSLKHAM